MNADALLSIRISAQLFFVHLSENLFQSATVRSSVDAKNENDSVSRLQTAIPEVRFKGNANRRRGENLNPLSVKF